MKVFLRKDVEQVGLSGEIITVGDGYGRNFLIPKGLAVEVTPQNEVFYVKRQKNVDNRQTVIATKTSLLAEKINAIKLIIKRKVHDDGKLYGSVNPSEIVDLLAEKNISITKNQIKLEKSIKAKGIYKVIIELTSRLQSTITLEVVAE